MNSREDLAQALKEEKHIIESSRDIEECDDDEKNMLRAILKEGLL